MLNIEEDEVKIPIEVESRRMFLQKYIDVLSAIDTFEMNLLFAKIELEEGY